jgi:HEAT repeat protein
MKSKYILSIIICQLCLLSYSIRGQNADQQNIDSLVNVLVKERRQWNEASERLQIIGEPAVDKLLEVLLDKTIDSWPRRKAAMTLGGISSQKIIKPCLNVFTDESEDIEIRNNACRALLSTDLSGYEDFFIEHALGDNSKIKNSCYQQLGHIGSDKAINFLISEFDNVDDMGKWIVLHDLEKTDNEKVNKIFIKALDDNTWWMINEYARDVLITRGEAVLNSLEQILNNPHNSEFLRWKAIWIISYLETDKKIPILQQALKDKSWVIRNEAEVALNK